MIILQIKNNAGPGNQMFMYAKAYSLAKKYNQKILIVSEISGYSVRQNILQYMSLNRKIVCGMIRLDWTKNQYIFRFFRKIIFDVILKAPFFHQITQPAKESRMVQTCGGLKKGHIYVVNGYWECHEYFDEYRQDLIQQFRPNYELDEPVAQFVDKVSSENSVVLHIRKGDFQQFGRLIDDDYYARACEKIRSQVGDCKMYVLTEDDSIAKEWENRYGAERIEFTTEHKYIDEWFAMRQCRHHVIANSTYSWWSSYLAKHEGTLVIVPSESDYLKAEPENDGVMYKNYYRNDDICV